ncbi:MAG TPA: hypothetical protein PLA68_01005 [Panacibacter sp.]|nr:hypothetical protein [Panacibacter sp.]
MKKILPALFILFSVNLTAQTSGYKVTMNGIADFKIDMKKAEVEKLLNQPVKLKNLLSKDEWMMDTIVYKYKDLDVSLIFTKQYIDDNKSDIVLWGIMSSSPLIKTPSGISVGDDKIKIVTIYDGYRMLISPDYENDNTIKSKTKSTVYLYSDDSGNQIVFHLEHNKIYSIAVSEIEEYD